MTSVMCVVCAGVRDKDTMKSCVYSLDSVFYGETRKLKTRGIHERCLNHLRHSVPRDGHPALLEIRIRQPPSWSKSVRPALYLSDPPRIYLPKFTHQHSDGTRHMMFSPETVRRMTGRQRGKRKPIPNQVKRALPDHCQECDSTEGLEVDHRVPVWIGGTNEVENLRVLCRDCHKQARANLPEVDPQEALASIISTELGKPINIGRVRTREGRG